MSKQRPNPDRMTNELAGASAFFRPAAPSSPSPTPTTPAKEMAPSQPTPVVPIQPTEAHEATRTPRTPVRPERRQMVRHAFELYLDQIESLRDLAEQQRRRGELSSMSRMVRDAIDSFLDGTQPKG